MSFKFLLKFLEMFALSLSLFLLAVSYGRNGVICAVEGLTVWFFLTASLWRRLACFSVFVSCRLVVE